MGEKNDVRRADILEAAGEEFIEKGFTAATTLAIARRAKISKRDLYRLFGSKQGLLKAMISARTQEMLLAPALPAPESLEAFRATLHAFGQMFLTALLHPYRTAFHRIAIAEAPGNREIGLALYEGGARPVIASVETFFAQAAAREFLAASDMELAVAAYFNMLIGSLQLRVLMGVRDQPTTMEIATQADRAVDVVMRLIAQPPRQDSAGETRFTKL